MVDAAAPRKAGSRAVPDARGSAVLEACVYTDKARALAAYRAACATATASPSQKFSWIDNWAKHLNPDFLVATIGPEAAPQFAIALEIVHTGPFVVARFMGGSHSNGSFAPLAGTIEQADLTALTDAVRKARPDIDMLALERLAERLGDMPNPLVGLKSAPSANLALAVDLQGGFDALLSRVSGKRKRKKHRSQQRKFEAVGGFRRIEAKTAAEVGAMLDAFFIMKEDRFRKLGIVNVFGEAQVQTFFRALFTDALTEGPPSYVLHGLEVGGKLRAVTGSSLAGDRLVCEFGSITEDDLAHTSPGDFLFYENIREACEQGFAVYDFSVGDEPYKRLWCDLEISQRDVLVPLNIRGAVLATGMRARNRVKLFVKNSPLFWRLAKALRKRGAQGVSSSQDD